ncbi:MAG: hypothetical protein GY810_20315 [Aureispira sp.]|nr:hypothetical protein [Aureispira sp.]
MEELENINRLIATKTAENNYLAMQLMLNVLDYSFEEAFLKLQLHNQNDQLLSMSIAHVRIDYEVDMQRMIYVPSAYADIERTIYYKGKLEPNSAQKLHADEDSIFSLGEDGPVENLKEIREDLGEICPYIEALYQLMEED